MSAVIGNWLNKELVLSRRVDSFEEDFRNGFLFGELLNLYQLQPDFPQFVDDFTPNAKVNNFKRLQPTLRNLKIKIDSRIANDIIQEKPGAALGLLHKIRSVVQDLHSGDLAVQRRLLTSIATGKGARGREAFEDIESHFYEERLRLTADNPKQLRMAHHLRQFTVEGQRQERERVAFVRARTDALRDRVAETREQRYTCVRLCTRTHRCTHEHSIFIARARTNARS